MLITDHQIAIEMNKFLLIIILFWQSVFAQNRDKDFYQLYEGSKLYPKIEKYILAPMNQINTVKEDGSVNFNMNGEWFVHYPGEDSYENISTADMEKLTFNSIKEIRQEKANIYYKRSKELLNEGGPKIPPPLGYDYFKIFLVVIENEKFAKVYEVYWVYTIQ